MGLVAVRPGVRLKLCPTCGRVKGVVWGHRIHLDRALGASASFLLGFLYKLLLLHNI